jgi:hypothetical protein
MSTTSLVKTNNSLIQRFPLNPPTISHRQVVVSEELNFSNYTSAWGFKDTDTVLWKKELQGWKLIQ